MHLHIFSNEIYTISIKGTVIIHILIMRNWDLKRLINFAMVIQLVCKEAWMNKPRSREIKWNLLSDVFLSGCSLMVEYNSHHQSEPGTRTQGIEISKKSRD